MTSNVLWYATRSTAIVGFVLMTATTSLGVVSTKRAMASKRWPRFATQALHRNLSLLAMAFLMTHIVTTILDTYVDIGWLSFVVPLTSDYRRPWVALGTTGFDILLLVVVSSLLRTKLPERVWRGLHWSAYAVWPLALFHFLETGTDAAHHRFGICIAFSSIAVMVGAIALRLLGFRGSETHTPSVREQRLPVGAR